MESSGSADASRPDHQTRVATHRHAAATVRHTAGHGGRGAAIARNVIPAGTRYGWAERCGSTQSRRCEAWRDVGPGHAPLRADGDSRGRLRTVLTVDGDGSRVAVRLCAGHYRIQHGGAARARRQTWRREEKFRLAAAIGGTALAHREGLRRRHRADADHVGRGRAGFVAHHGRAAASVCRDGYVDIWIDDSDADAAWRSAFRKRAGAGCVLRDRLACGRGRSGRDRTAIGRRRTA